VLFDVERVWHGNGWLARAAVNSVVFLEQVENALAKQETYDGMVRARGGE